MTTSDLLWPPADYPDLTPAEPDVSGCTLDVFTAGVSELSANTPAEAAITTRTVRPLFVKGQGGVLRWSVSVAVLAGAACDVQQQVIWLDDDDAQVGRWTGQAWSGQTGIVLSARLPVPRLATQVQLRVLSLCDTAGGDWTETDSRLDQIPADDPYVPVPRDETFADVSAEGVAAPPPPAGLSGAEATSPARRSPQVRWCQTHDSVRPDLAPKQNARSV